MPALHVGFLDGPLEDGNSKIYGDGWEDSG